MIGIFLILAGCQYAIYATTNKIMAILFSVGCIEVGNHAERILLRIYKQIQIHNNLFLIAQMKQFFQKSYLI